MKGPGYLVLLLTLSTARSAEQDCCITTWVNKTIEYVRCLKGNDSFGNITLHICIESGNSQESDALTFTSSLDEEDCAKRFAVDCCNRREETLNEEAVNEAAKFMENSLKNITTSNFSNPNDIIFYSENVTPKQTDVYKSPVSDTNIGLVLFDKTVNLTGASFAVREQKQEGVHSAKPFEASLDNSTNSRTSSIVQLFSDRLVAVGFFDSNKRKIIPSSLVMSIDTSNVSKAALCSIAKSEAQKLEEVSVYSSSCENTTPICVFADNGSWPSTGCKVVGQTDKEITCECNHTTVFAVLLTTTVVSIPLSVKIVTYIAEAISIVFLLVTVFLLAKVRNRVRGDRVKVQICVSSSLLCLHILNVFHDPALYGSDAACETIAVLIHYFLLCTACWMLMEGVTLLFKTMDSVMRLLNGKNARKFSIFRYVFSFSVPAVIVLISASVGFSNETPNYMPLADGSPTYSQCFVGNDMRLGAVIIPVSIALFCCLLIIGRMFYVVFRMSSESERFKPSSQRRQTTSGEFVEMEHVKAALKATLVLVPVLGIPWFLLFLAQTNEVFMFVNAVVNGLQGMMLFFVYCVIGKEVRKAILNSYARKVYSLSSSHEFSSKQRRMTGDPSNIGQATMSTNVGDVLSEEDHNSYKSTGDKATGDEKF